MKSRLVFLVLAAAVWLVPAGAARAQDLAAPPPAYAVAHRLTVEAQSEQGARDLQTAHNRAVQAVAKYNEVVASRSYGSGPWGAEALYQEALLQNSVLRDPNAAVQTLQRLQNNNHSGSYPDVRNAAPLLNSLESQVDRQNSHKTLYHVMSFFVGLCGGRHFSYSYALAILLISLLVRLALTPLSNKQFASMREMQRLQPKIKEVQNRYKNDKELQGRKVMELYKENGINPAAGCLPMLVQLPILYLLYYMIRLYQYQFVHGKFLWIGSPLAHLIPGGFVAPNLGQQDVPLLVLYALSMYVTQKLTVTPSIDPQQAEQQRMMAVMTPFISTVFFLQWHLPSAFVLYYLIFNVLSTIQQKYYMRQHHAGIHGEPPADDGGSGGPSAKQMVVLQDTANGSMTAVNGKSGGRRGLPSRQNSLPPERNGVSQNGATPAAKGVISPQKVHPKKKRR